MKILSSNGRNIQRSLNVIPAKILKKELPPKRRLKALFSVFLHLQYHHTLLIHSV